MKEILGLLWAVGWGATAVYLNLRHGLGKTSFGLLLGFAILGALCIVNYDTLISWEGLGIKVKAARKEIETAKDAAIKEVQKEIAVQRGVIDSLVMTAIATKEQLQEAIEIAAPPTLSLLTQQTQETDKGYKTTIGFTPSKNQPLGIMVFVIEVIEGAAAKITEFSPAVMIGTKSTTISQDGKKARLQYSSSIPGLQQVKIEVSNTCKLSVSGNYIQEPILVNVPSKQKQ